MTKADIVSEIAKSTGVEKVQVQAIVEAFMDSIKTSLTNKNNVYLRGFGSFGLFRRHCVAMPLRGGAHNLRCKRARRPQTAIREPAFPPGIRAPAAKNRRK